MSYVKVTLAREFIAILSVRDRYSNRRLPLRGHLAQAEANTLRYLLDGNRIHSRDDHSIAQQVGYYNCMQL